MYRRDTFDDAVEQLAYSPAIALVGPRQVGKTTLALDLAESRPAVYLDLESPDDRVKLEDPVGYLRPLEDKLVILDEIHRTPELFPVLRGLIDQGRRRGRRAGRFLVLGSASIDLLRQSSESLAGRIAYVEMGPLHPLEIAASQPADDFIDQLWIRGGFPESYLAPTADLSLQWRRNFIRTYLERDIPLFGPRVPAETMGRLWTMLAHNHGCLLNASQLAISLMISAQTVTRYVDLLADLLLVRRLMPYHANTGKRLVKAPKVYLRDSGVVHALLGIRDFEALAGHPVVGFSWESFVIETLIAVAPARTMASFYRTSAGAEIDLLLDMPGHGLWAIDVKRGRAPKLQRGFHTACDDVKATRRLVVYSGEESFPIPGGVEAVGLQTLAAELKKMRRTSARAVPLS